MGRRFQPEEEHFRFAPFNRLKETAPVARPIPDRGSPAELRLYTLACEGAVTVARIADGFGIPEKAAARVLKRHGLAGDTLRVGELMRDRDRRRLLADDLQRANDSHWAHKAVIRYNSGRIGWL